VEGIKRSPWNPPRILELNWGRQATLDLFTLLGGASEGHPGSLNPTGEGIRWPPWIAEPSGGAHPPWSSPLIREPYSGGHQEATWIAEPYLGWASEGRPGSLNPTREGIRRLPWNPPWILEPYWGGHQEATLALRF
jgi:hypothetical protein